MSSNQSRVCKHFDALWHRIENFPSEEFCGTIYYTMRNGWKAWAASDGRRVISQAMKGKTWYVTKEGGYARLDGISAQQFLRKDIK